MRLRLIPLVLVASVLVGGCGSDGAPAAGTGTAVSPAADGAAVSPTAAGTVPAPRTSPSATPSATPSIPVARHSVTGT